MAYLIVPDYLLSAKQIHPADKLIISYIMGLTQAGRAFYGSMSYMADKIGIPESNLVTRLQRIIKAGIVVDNDGELMAVSDEYKIRSFVSGPPSVPPKPKPVQSYDMFDAPTRTPAEQAELQKILADAAKAFAPPY